MPSDQAIARANAFRAMHRAGDPVVLINVWDVASARVVAAHPATRALATASWSMAAANGYEDGERLPLEITLAMARQIAAAVTLPVTVDFEKGYAASIDGVKENVLRLIESGAIGLNIEDSVNAEDGPFRSLKDASARVAAVREAADQAGLPLVINARTDVLVGGEDASKAIERGNAYLAAGADCVFVLGVDRASIERIVAGIPGPVAFMTGSESMSVAELARAGAARVSFGPGPMGVAYAALGRLATVVHSGGQNPPELAYRPGHA